MAWVIPKIDWAPSDGVDEGDLNRIEGDISYLYSIAHKQIFTGTIPNASSGQINTCTINRDKVIGIIGVYKAANNFIKPFGVHSYSPDSVEVSYDSDSTKLYLSGIGADAKNMAYQITVFYTD